MKLVAIVTCAECGQKVYRWDGKKYCSLECCRLATIRHQREWRVKFGKGKSRC